VKDRVMQQGDQTVLSLRPGGGRGSRLFNPRLEQSSSSSSTSSSISLGDLPHLRPRGGAPFLKVFIITFLWIYSLSYVNMFVLILCDWLFGFWIGSAMLSMDLIPKKTWICHLFFSLLMISNCCFYLFSGLWD